jgi:cobalt-zinc-cadmium efflux system protein
MGHACQHAHEEVHASGRSFMIAIVFNAIFVVIQIIYAIKAHSTSLLADALHNVGDVFSLIISGVANHLLLMKPTATKTYGLKKISIMAAVINGALMLFSAGIIVAEAVDKWLYPDVIALDAVIWVAVIGIIVNFGTALLFIRDNHDLNIRSAFLHLLYDALVSVGVVIAAVIMAYTHYWWLDAVVAMLIAVVILFGTWGFFKDSFGLMIDGVPKHISFDEIFTYLSSIPGVESVHDLHIWAISTKENALSAHLVAPAGAISQDLMVSCQNELKQSFHIHHITLQVDSNADSCSGHCFL